VISATSQERIGWIASLTTDNGHIQTKPICVIYVIINILLK